MKLRQIVETLTTKPQSYTKEFSSKNFKGYKFSFEDIKGKIRKIKVGFILLQEISDYGVNIYEIDFVDEAKEDYEITNFGKADVVFATIIDIIKKFISDETVDGIAFRDLSNDKRIRIYKILLNQFITFDLKKIQLNFYGDDFIFIVKKERMKKLEKTLKELNVKD